MVFCDNCEISLSIDCCVKTKFACCHPPNGYSAQEENLETNYTVANQPEHQIINKDLYKNDSTTTTNTNESIH